jgi:hypothetical protein
MILVVFPGLFKNAAKFRHGRSQPRDAGARAAVEVLPRLRAPGCAIHARLDDVDFEAQGIHRGEFDTVIAADILEHLVNPWELLARLRPFLAPRAQDVASIPNIRNITVVSQLLLGGTFNYAERKLLDITHLRFFTLAGIRAMFEETGYAFEDRRALLLPTLEPVYGSYHGRGPDDQARAHDVVRHHAGRAHRAVRRPVPGALPRALRKTPTASAAASSSAGAFPARE